MKFPRRVFARISVLSVVMGGLWIASGQTNPIALPTAQIALVGRFARGPVNLPVAVTASGFAAVFGSDTPVNWPAEIQARQYFANGGRELHVVRVLGTGALADALAGDAGSFTGFHALDQLTDLRLLVAPELSLLAPEAFTNLLGQLRAFLEPRRVFFILDPPPGLANATAAVNWVEASVPVDASFCALYYPYLQILLDNTPLTVPASGAMAGVYATNDAMTAIWHSPAGSAFPLQASGLTPVITSTDSDLLNAHNIDAIREFSGVGIVPWGARALDRYNPDNRYVAVVRTRSWAAASVQRALAFAATQDNGEPLWSQIRTLVGDFLYSLYQQGAFVGSTPSSSYFVKCDATTTTATDIAAHRVNVIYGLALLRAGEFDLTTLSAATYDSGLAVPSVSIQRSSVAGDLVLAYPTVAGFNYELKSITDLRGTPWDTAAAPVNGDGAWRRLSIPMVADGALYRLLVTPIR